MDGVPDTYRGMASVTIREADGGTPATELEKCLRQRPNGADPPVRCGDVSIAAPRAPMIHAWSCDADRPG